MSEKKTGKKGSRKKPASDRNDPSPAHRQAEKDIHDDPDFSKPDSSDELDEGELARRDNSEERAADEFGA